MAKSIRGTKKKPGRPKTTGTGTQIGMRWHAADLTAIDAWRRQQTDAPSRPEAIRRLVELGLAAAQSRQRGVHKGAAKAKAMAGEQIDRMADQTAHEEDRQHRKRRLLKGPSEFRDMRADLPKAKPGR